MCLPVCLALWGGGPAADTGKLPGGGGEPLPLPAETPPTPELQRPSPGRGRLPPRWPKPPLGRAAGASGACKGAGRIKRRRRGPVLVFTNVVCSVRAASRDNSKFVLCPGTRWNLCTPVVAANAVLLMLKFITTAGDRCDKFTCSILEKQFAVARYPSRAGSRRWGKSFCVSCGQDKGRKEGKPALGLQQLLSAVVQTCEV